MQDSDDYHNEDDSDQQINMYGWTKTCMDVAPFTYRVVQKSDTPVLILR